MKYASGEKNVINEKFDYIIIKDEISYIEKYKNKLQENGTFLLLLNNRWGVTYFAGSDKFETIYGNTELLSKDEIQNKLTQLGYKNYKFFYPLPNYEFANVIYSDEYLPKFTDSKLANNNIYLQDTSLVFNEIELLRGFTKKGDFTKFTNSFFIEINPKSQEKAIFFNNIRKDEYRLITKIYSSKVEKEKYSDASQEQLKSIQENIEELNSHSFNLLDKPQNNKIISKFFDKTNMYEDVVREIELGNIQRVIDIIKKYYKYVKSKFENDRVIKINKDYFSNIDTNDLFIVKKLYIDLVLENMFLDGQDVYVYDQEWFIENCPIEFLLFRVINNMYIINSEISKFVSRKDMLNEFGILKYEEAFTNAEVLFQNKVLNEEISKLYQKGNELIIAKKDLINAKENALDIKLYKTENLKKEKYILELQKEAGDVKAELGLYKAENTKKEKYILELQQQIAELQEKINNN